MTPSPTAASGLLARIEHYYDAVPRPVASCEPVGPFTLFVARPATGWQFYARPTLGLRHEFTPDDVRRVLDRQVALGLPRAVEWVHETTPSLLAAAQEALAGDASLELEECALLVLPPGTPVDPGTHTRTLDADDPGLPLVVGAVDAAFSGSGAVEAKPVGARARMIAEGLLVIVAGYDEQGAVVGGGSAAPRGDAAELMGIGVAPAAQGRGIGSAITRTLVDAARAGGADLVLLSAATDSAAGIYRTLGFVDVGTACILGVGDG